MKIQYVGDGTPSYQSFTYPGGRLVKWQTFTTSNIPAWVETATPGTFLVDGKPNPGPVKPKPEPKKPAEPKAKPGKDKTNG